MAAYFLDLKTTLEYLGAKCLLENKVIFVPWKCKHISTKMFTVVTNTSTKWHAQAQYFRNSDKTYTA